MIKNYYEFLKLDEALKLKDARELTKLFIESGGKDRYNDIFKGKDRIYLELIGDNEYNSKIEKEIENVLKNNGYALIDYLKGNAQKIGDDRIFKIQRVLARLSEHGLINKMNADPIRSSSKRNDKIVVISRHGIDIGGASTERGWTSCLSLNGGANKQYIYSQIKEGALIAYLINRDDTNIKNPIARKLISIYVNNNNPSESLLYPNTEMHGNYNLNDFQQTLLNFVNKINRKANPSLGNYKLKAGCYSENVKTISLSNNSELFDISNLNIKDIFSEDTNYGTINYSIRDFTQIENLIESLVKNNNNEKEILAFIDRLKGAGLLKTIIDYINNLSNVEFEKYCDTQIKYIAILIRGIGLKRFSDIDKNKLDMLVKTYINKMGPKIRSLLTMYKSLDDESGWFMKWTIDRAVSLSLIKPEFVTIISK